MSFEIFGFDKSKSFNKTIFKDEPPADFQVVDPLPDLVAALADGRNWSSDLPADARALVTVRTRLEVGVVAVHPLGAIAVRQRVAPLNLDLARFGQARLAGDQRFSITTLTLDSPAPATDPVLDDFAPGQFLDLTDSERLSRPSFEPLEAGVSVVAGALVFGGQAAGEAGLMAVTDLAYETCILGERGECVAEAEPRQPGLRGVLDAAALGPAARAALGTSGLARYRTASPSVRVQAPAFAIASVTNLLAVAGDGEPAATPTRFASYTAAEQALQRRLPTAAEGLSSQQVVWKFELAEEDV